MAILKRMRDERGAWVDRIIGSPDQPVADFPARCDVCEHVSTADMPECLCADGQGGDTPAET